PGRNVLRCYLQCGDHNHNTEQEPPSKSNAHGFSFRKTGRVCARPSVWTQSVGMNQELAVAASTLIARLRMLVHSATIIAGFRLAFCHQLAFAAVASTVVAWLRFAFRLDGEFPFAVAAIVSRLGFAFCECGGGKGCGC